MRPPEIENPAPLLGSGNRARDIPKIGNPEDSKPGESPQAFDWDRDPSVILHDQAAVAAYFNSFGELIIKQRDTLGEEANLFIAPENVEKFLKGLGDRASPSAPTTMAMLKVVKGGAE
jgi:hypothetical protein